MLFIMWVYMETWIVQDGAPELDRGSYLPGVGLRPDCLSMGPPRTPVDGIAELADRAGGHLHEVTGLARAARERACAAGMPARSS
jgi:hypothetical protein